MFRTKHHPLTLVMPACRKSGSRQLFSLVLWVGEPLTVAIAHSKGGVGKTTTTMVLGKYLAREFRVLLKDTTTRVN